VVAATAQSIVTGRIGRVGVNALLLVGLESSTTDAVSCQPSLEEMIVQVRLKSPWIVSTQPAMQKIHGHYGATGLDVPRLVGVEKKHAIVRL